MLSDPRGYVNLGAVQLKLQLFDAGVDSYERAVVLSPEDVDLHTWLANAYDRAGQYEEALAEYEAALNIDRRRPGVYRERALAHSGKNRYREAVDDLDRALQLGPENIKFLSRRRDLYQRPHPMTAFCEGTGRGDRRYARAKKVSGLGRWYYYFACVMSGEPGRTRGVL